MKNDAWKIIAYTKRNGQVPMDDFLNTLNPKQEAKVLRSIQLLEEFGPSMGMPHVKFLGDGIYELRTQLASDIFRTTLFHYQDQQIVLLHGFKKKTQKTPPREIRKAKAYRNDFLSQIEEGF